MASFKYVMQAFMNACTRIHMNTDEYWVLCGLVAGG